MTASRRDWMSEKALKETAVLILKALTFQSLDYASLGDALVKRYGFLKIEDKEAKTFGKESGVYDWEFLVEKYSFVRTYKGSYMDATVQVMLLGEKETRRETVKISETEEYVINIVDYQMIKMISESGYSIQKFQERLMVDLGLEAKEQEWAFHKGEAI